MLQMHRLIRAGGQTGQQAAEKENFLCPPHAHSPVHQLRSSGGWLYIKQRVKVDRRDLKKQTENKLRLWVCSNVCKTSPRVVVTGS